MFYSPHLVLHLYPLTRSRGVRHLPLEFAIVVCHAKMVYTLFKNRTSEPEYDGTQRQRGGPPKQYRFVLFRGCAQGRKTRARSLSCARQKIRFYIYNSKAVLYLWCTQTSSVVRYYLWLCRAFINLGGGAGGLCHCALLLSRRSRGAGGGGKRIPGDWMLGK